MAKKTGLGGQFYVGGYDLSNDIGQLDNVTLERNLLEVTGMDRSAVERLGGLYTSSIGFTGFFNPAALKEHVVRDGNLCDMFCYGLLRRDFQAFRESETQFATMSLEKMI